MNFWARRLPPPFKEIFMTPLRERMINAMVLRGFAERTRWTYLTAIKQMAQFYDDSPELLSDEQIQGYLLHLIQVRHRSHSTINITSSTIRFLMCDVRCARRSRTAREDPAGSLPTTIAGTVVTYRGGCIAERSYVSESTHILDDGLRQRIAVERTVSSARLRH
jgi:hypothetical protein